jgi:hypothetical protein
MRSAARTKAPFGELERSQANPPPCHHRDPIYRPPGECRGEVHFSQITFRGTPAATGKGYLHFIGSTVNALP